MFDVVLTNVWGAEKGDFPPCVIQMGDKSWQKNTVGLQVYLREEA